MSEVEIANAFVGHYYQTFASNPEGVASLYVSSRQADNNNNNNNNNIDHRIDLWGEVASALHAHGIACIAYVATQGPAMLKHGPTKAYDYDATTGTAPSIQRWHDHVHQQYGNDTIETLQYAFCDIIIQYYAQRYGHLVDGWWFDHAHFGNVPLLHDMVKKYNPHTVVAFNRGRKVPLHNNNPGYEDYTVRRT